MVITKEIAVGKKTIICLSLNLLSKNLIVLRGSNGYVMCGYLDLTIAEKFQDAAVRVTGVSSIEEALEARVDSCTGLAEKLGIHKGQPIQEVLPLIA